MNIDIVPEALLRQFGYQVNTHTLSQINSAIVNTPGFDNFSKHLLSLKDAIAHNDGFIALSNTHNYFKIKCEIDNSQENIKEFEDTLMHWSDKYKVLLQQIDNKPTYYILGQQ